MAEVGRTVEWGCRVKWGRMAEVGRTAKWGRSVEWGGRPTRRVVLRVIEGRLTRRTRSRAQLGGITRIR
jgi:hypothetical protein